jgi:mono/diheme cytochrome c family protein
MRSILWFLIGVLVLPVVLVSAGLVYVKTAAHGFSANSKPGALETWLATEARQLALPADAKQRRNPIANSTEVIAQGKAHWADHCAVCHGNDGKGHADMGAKMYPPAPDMTQRGTQEMTDGELFYIIENGVRLTGMPAWGSAHGGEDDSWKLVHFIRHLPQLTEGDLREMEKMNPKSPAEMEEEKQEEEFLNHKQ